MNINIDIQNFLSTLPVIGKGMLGIFAVTIVIIILTYIINKATENRD